VLGEKLPVNKGPGKKKDQLNHLCDFKESHLIRGETANVDA
jgi:hypothetical protein